MRAVTVDLRPPRAGPRRLLWAVAGALAAGLVAQAYIAVHQRTQLEQLRAQAESLRMTLDRPPALPPADALSRAAVVEEHATLDRGRGFPLQAVLGAVESVRIAGVRVTTIQVQPASGDITLELETAGHDALLAYVEALKAAPAGAALQLQRLQAPDGSAPGTAVLHGHWSALGR